jgi:hypothetical protein
LRSSHVHIGVLTAFFVPQVFGLIAPAPSFADDVTIDPSTPGPVQVATVPTADDADPAAVTACAAFAEVLDGSSTYYGDFADTLEGSGYADPAVSDAPLCVRAPASQ